MDAVEGFRLSPGHPAPVQQSQVSCGSACLVVARMMRDAALARWVSDGVATLGRGEDDRAPQDRFAQLEREVMTRTNALVPLPGRAQLPWPRFLGTPPWGARVELENGAAAPGTGYEVSLVRQRRRSGLQRAYEEVTGRIGVSRPALLYVGNARLPRHVTLVFVGPSGDVLVYEPARGAVLPLSRPGLVDRELGLGGWDQPWLVVQPVRQRTVAVRQTVEQRGLSPRRAVARGTYGRDAGR